MSNSYSVNESCVPNTENALDELVRKQQSGVILNHPGKRQELMSLGRALNRALLGKTHSFTAIVGYFHHRPELTRHGDDFNDDPARIIIEEAKNENVRLVGNEDFESTSFRLLAGLLCSKPAAIAARVWYWFCRWRYQAQNGLERSDATRLRFLKRAEELKKQGNEHPFRTACLELVSPETNIFDGCPGPFQLRDDFIDELKVLPGEDLKQISKRWAQLRFSLGEEIVVERDVQFPKHREESGRQAAAILAGFLLQRKGELKIAQKYLTVGDGLATIATFHPKIYIVERAPDKGHGKDTIAFVGSNNWSDKALGAIETGASRRGTLGNVELATIHTMAGYGWSEPTSIQEEKQALSTTQSVCNAAHFIYDTVDTCLGSWCAEYDLLTVEQAHELASYTAPAKHEYTVTKQEDIEFPPAAEGSASYEPPEALKELAPDLQILVERLLGLSDAGQFDLLRRLAVAGKLYNGRRPERYQIDGAIRLISMLSTPESNEAEDIYSRGAFLTDEAGLGKTLIAQMVTTQMIVERLMQRYRQQSKAPLRVALIAPARLVGRDNLEAPSGWYAHAQEIKHAVYTVLETALMEQKRNPLQFSSKAETLNPNELMSQLDIRVISAGAFSRELLANKTDWDVQSVADLELIPGSISSDPVGDLLHVACSEIVSIDESHNFRNPGSYGTRALRFALSLPTPGERQWSLGWFEDLEKTKENSSSWATHRRILCLSATPFNNKLEDLVTQIGHFLQVQNWEPAYRAQKQIDTIEDVVKPLNAALTTWRRLQPEALLSPSLLRDHFQVILRFVYRHLRSGRSLSKDADEVLEAERMKKDLRSRYSDKGPEYEWPEGAEELKQTLAAVYEWLKERHKQDESATSEKHLDREREALVRLDALLCRMMVQRSRARVLKISASSQGAEIDKMFRKPRVPRHPLALNKVQRDKNTFEGQILEGLYELLGEELEDTVQDGTQLDLFAYRLGVWRARLPYGKLSEGEGGGLEQTIKNNLGFQRVNLVKRLQSSPYAFMRTVLRGPLRRTLQELALIERMVASFHGADEAGSGVTLAQLQAHPLAVTLEKASTVLMNFSTELIHSSHIRSLASILDGYANTEDLCFFLSELGGFFSQRTEANLDTAIQKRFERDYVALQDAFGLGPNNNTFEPDLFEKSWSHALLHDILDESSRLLNDVRVALNWTMQDTSSHKGLIPLLYQDLDKVGIANRTLYAKPFSELRNAFIYSEFKPYELKAIRCWLLNRLRDDSRLTSLISWLVLQQAAEADLKDKITKELPGGSCTLVFSEYTDTQEYILATLAALVCLARKQPEQMLEVTSIIFETAKDIADRLEQQSEEVRAQQKPDDTFSQPGMFETPIQTRAGSWFRKWSSSKQSEDDNSCEIICQIILSLGEKVARVCSSDMRRLCDKGALTTVDSDEVAEDSSDGGSESTVAEGDVIDAFSPWYQIAPPANGERADEFRKRLVAAATHPVKVLFSTEVLSEGVNLQECGVVIHYDLPWNPTRLIQRNGRIDRRIFQLYEDERQRRDLIRKLSPISINESGEEEYVAWNAPAFVAPRQVYHLTVVPVEPEGIHLVERVRERLFEKLDTIRGLFGLSYWPVVLDRETAKNVLSGELDYETPGFRRREELFKCWSILREHTPELEHKKDRLSQGRSITLKVGIEFLRALTRSVLHLPQEESNEAVEHYFRHWEQVLAAGVVTWSPHRPVSVPVRSGPEWSTANARGVGAISGVLLAHPTERDGLAEGQCRAVMWATHGDSRHRLLPALAQANSAKLDKAGAYQRAIADLSTLGHANSLQELKTEWPSAPSAMAEEILTTAVSYLVEQPIRLSNLHKHNLPYPSQVGALESLEPLFQRDAILWHLNQPMGNLNTFGRFKNKVESSEIENNTSTPPRAINFWLVIDTDTDLHPKQSSVES